MPQKFRFVFRFAHENERTLAIFTAFDSAEFPICHNCKNFAIDLNCICNQITLIERFDLKFIWNSLVHRIKAFALFSIHTFDQRLLQGSYRSESAWVPPNAYKKPFDFINAKELRGFIIGANCIHSSFFGSNTSTDVFVVLASIFPPAT